METVKVSNVKSVGKKSAQMSECKQKEFHVPDTVEPQYNEPLYNKVLGIMNISKIPLAGYYQCCILIGWATTRLYVIAR